MQNEQIKVVELSHLETLNLICENLGVPRGELLGVGVTLVVHDGNNLLGLARIVKEDGITLIPCFRCVRSATAAKEALRDAVGQRLAARCYIITRRANIGFFGMSLFSKIKPSQAPPQIINRAIKRSADTGQRDLVIMRRKPNYI